MVYLGEVSFPIQPLLRASMLFWTQIGVTEEQTELVYVTRHKFHARGGVENRAREGEGPSGLTKWDLRNWTS